MGYQMKVLLTGANGFVGSHILDRLLESQIPAVALLRPNSDRTFISGQLSKIEVRTANPSESSSLDAILKDVTHVIHCAGATKALNAASFFAINQGLTRDLVAAVNRRGTQIQRFVLISSLAAAGPATTEHPRGECDKPQPVSDYGRSKMAAEEEVINGCKTDWTIIRPPAVYGPRDREFLRVFKAVQSHFRPRFGGGRQPLTLVYVADLAEAIVAALTHPNASRETFFAGSAEVVSAAALTERVAVAAKTWTLPLPLPKAILWLACQWAELVTRMTRKPNVLSAQKWAELKAPGWVCDVSKLKNELSFECRTGLTEGIEKTLAWYKSQGWV